MNLLKKIFVFISLFFITAIPAFACTVTATPDHGLNNGSPTSVTFHVTSAGSYGSYSSSINTGSLDESSFNQDNCTSGWSGGASYFQCGNSPGTSPFNETGNITISGDDVVNYTLYQNSGFSGTTESCNVNLTLSAGGGGGGSGGITIDPTVQGNLNAGINSLGAITVEEAINILRPILLVIGTILVIIVAIARWKDFTKSGGDY